MRRKPLALEEAENLELPRQYEPNHQSPEAGSPKQLRCPSRALLCAAHDGLVVLPVAEVAEVAGPQLQHHETMKRLCRHPLGLLALVV